jgi:hypothetical protein
MVLSLHVTGLLIRKYDFLYTLPFSCKENGFFFTRYHSHDKKMQFYLHVAILMIRKYINDLNLEPTKDTKNTNTATQYLSFKTTKI